MSASSSKKEEDYHMTRPRAMSKYVSRLQPLSDAKSCVKYIEGQLSLITLENNIRITSFIVVFSIATIRIHNVNKP
jgi:hypothetical protein